MAVCERAAYNIEFLGMQSGDLPHQVRLEVQCIE
jgi:hypothetical protein